jgi:D-alanyl-D-alanine carboxypeptidase/D-alanyl-D-alanine-endopeptidase (penicillin-binding protein 4)
MENRTTTIKRVTVTKRTKYRDTRGRTRYRTVHSYKGESLKVQIEDGVVVASGSIAVGTKARHLPVEVRDSGAHFATVVRGVLENEGISIAGKARSSADENALYAGVDPLPLITHHSAPLSELLKIINKRSHNEYAEYLLQTLEKDLECRGLITAGEEPVRQFASENQVGKCELVDGSGLSHQNFVSPLAVVNLLKYVHDQSYFETYMKSLAVAGIDGTLARRMHNSPARGKVYAKTGTVSGVSALSGYAVNHDGKIYAFALLSNNLRSRTLVHQAEDHLCKLLVEMEGS